MTDAEHGNYDEASQHDAFHAIAALGVSPIARCPGMGSEAWGIRVALDAGAHGIMIPLLSSKVRSPFHPVFLSSTSFREASSRDFDDEEDAS